MWMCEWFEACNKLGPLRFSSAGPLYFVRYKWEERTPSFYGLKRYSTLADRVDMDRSNGRGLGADLDDVDVASIICIHHY